MTVFIVLAVVMTLAAIAAAAWPLFRPAAAAAEGAAPRPDRVAAAVVCLLVPLTAVAFYTHLSTWPWDPAAQLQAADPHAGMAGQDGGSLDEAMKGLERRLVSQPDDVEGWKILARTYIVTERYDRARDAYAKVLELTKGADTDAVLGLAETQVLLDENQFEGEAGATFERIAAASPDNPKALWYSGLVAYRKQDWKLARERWGALTAMDVPQNIRQVLDERLAELDAKLGGTPVPAGKSVAAAAAERPAMTVPTPSAATDAPATPGQTIALRVELAPALQSRVQPDAPLFVLARDPAGGPPVAVVRRTAGELPFDLTLTDQNVMTPGMTLGMFDELVLVARVSFSGRPMATSGDLFGEIRYDFGGRQPVRLIIDRVVP